MTNGFVQFDFLKISGLKAGKNTQKNINKFFFCNLVLWDLIINWEFVIYTLKMPLD